VYASEVLISYEATSTLCLGCFRNCLKSTDALVVGTVLFSELHQRLPSLPCLSMYQLAYHRKITQNW